MATLRLLELDELDLDEQLSEDELVDEVLELLDVDDDEELWLELLSSPSTSTISSIHNR
jgi:hypothetical protein